MIGREKDLQSNTASVTTGRMNKYPKSLQDQKFSFG